MLAQPPTRVVTEERIEVLAFWGKQYGFSNFCYAPFSLVENGNEKCFATVEQFYQYNKCIYHERLDLAKEIFKTPDPREGKQIAKGIKWGEFGRESGHWFLDKEKIMRMGLRAKFTQNLDLKQMLLNTGKGWLVETSPHDEYWGVGLHMDDPLFRRNTDNWGRNRLGTILMEVRDEIRFYCP